MNYKLMYKLAGGDIQVTSGTHKECYEKLEYYVTYHHFERKNLRIVQRT